MKLVAVVCARLTEASTYAGLSALCLAVFSALSQVGVGRYIALCGAVLTAIGAIAKSENDVGLAEAMDRVTQLMPVLTKTAVSIEGILAENTQHQP